jgi:hypothetical protein
MTAPPFTGGRRLLARAAAIGGAGAALTAVGAALDARRAAFAWLVAVVYWTGIAVAALVFLMANRAAGARWYTVLRRLLETIPCSLVALAVLFVPVLLGARLLYPWLNPAGLSAVEQHLWEHRHAWLNLPAFVARAVAYFAIWIAVAGLLRRWSVRQDASGDPALTARARRLAAGGLPLVALAITFAAVDWQMSLSAFIASTIFGVYWFAGSLVGALAVLILAMAAAAREEPMRGALNANHVHSMGKYLFAFTAFWAYIALSQYLLIWIANLPEEVPWYLVRGDTGWRPVGIFLVVFHFALPFLILMPRAIKRRVRPLVVMAVWMLVVHYVDVYWVVMPALSPGGPRPSWMDLAAFAGVGGIAVAFVVWRLRGHPLLPARDPFLEASLNYEPHQ